MRVAIPLGLLLGVSGWGCGLFGPSCLERQQRGSVTTITGEVLPAEVTSHLVRYETQGSQNDVSIDWVGRSTPGGPRIRLYATQAACVDFRPPPAANIGACSPLGMAGSSGEQYAATLIITNGRGNPSTLGPSPEYKLWVVGDPGQTARYTMNATWFFGPDC